MLACSVMRRFVLGLVMFGSACGSATQTQDTAVVGRADAELDTAVDASLAPVDADLCDPRCEAVAHPEACMTDWSDSFDLGFDGGACEARPLAACSLDAGADVPLVNLLYGCGGLPDESTVVVTFSQGCATHLYSVRVSASQLACYVGVLQASRFDCLDQIPCLSAAYSTIP